MGNRRTLAAFVAIAISMIATVAYLWTDDSRGDSGPTQRVATTTASSTDEHVESNPKGIAAKSAPENESFDVDFESENDIADTQGSIDGRSPGTTDPASHEKSGRRELTRQFNQDPVRTFRYLEAGINEAISNGEIAAEKEIELIETLTSASADNQIAPGLTDSLLGLRCSTSVCEITFDRDTMPTPSTSIPILARVIGQSDDSIETVLHAPNPDEESVWSVYVIRDSFFD